MQNKAHILSTAFIDKLLIQKAGANGIEIDVCPFIETEPITDAYLAKEIEPLYAQALHVVFTSVNGISTPLPPEGGVMWRVYCIGNATQKAVIDKFGSNAIAGTANNAGELAELILKDPTIKEVVFFCGDKRRDELPGKLREGHVSVKEIIVYRTIETPKRLIKNYDGILFFSPSAVNSFFSVNSVEPATTLFAIGNTTANAIKELSDNIVIVSEQPDKEQLVDIMLAHYNDAITMKNE